MSIHADPAEPPSAALPPKGLLRVLASMLRFDVSASGDSIEFARSPFLALLRIGRHFVPTSWRPRLRGFLFARRPLTFTLPSGTHLRIANDTDWCIYTEVFRRGEYDFAIDLALRRSDDESCVVLDLGANVGFFTLRAVDIASGREPVELRVTAIEADADQVQEFTSRVLADNGLVGKVRVIRGLVGAASGTATLYQTKSHGDRSIFRRSGSTGGGTEYEFVDVSAILANHPVIHLLKCDIEGAELQFIRNFPDVLRKSRVAVFELHDELCDTAECMRLLRSYGFPHERLIRRTGRYSIQCVWR